MSGFLSRLTKGLARSAGKLGEGLGAVFTKRRLDEEALSELEDALIAADLGTEVTKRIVANFRKSRFGKEVTESEIKEALATEIAEILAPVARPLTISPERAPHVVLVVGVNGNGKTTTIGKLALQYREQGLKPILAAGDTFRAAAVEQLQVWGERTGAPVVTAPANSDPAGLAFDALARAKAEGRDVLLIDTAGRLHNKSALMEELQKIIRVIRKQDPTAPHSTILVLDATTGQNAITQVSGHHRPHRHQTRRLGTRRHCGRTGRAVRPAGACGGRGRAGGGFETVLSDGFCTRVVGKLTNLTRLCEERGDMTLHRDRSSTPAMDCHVVCGSSQ